MPSNETKPPVVAERKTVRSPGFSEFYANSVQGAFTPWDIELTFGRIGKVDGESVTSEMAAVVMSPQHAKAVAKVIAHAVEMWESQFGPIVLTGAQEPRQVGPKGTKPKV